MKFDIMFFINTAVAIFVGLWLWWIGAPPWACGAGIYFAARLGFLEDKVNRMVHR